MAKTVKKKAKKIKKEQEPNRNITPLKPDIINEGCSAAKQRSLDNLKLSTGFKPGQSGNPKGAPRARTNFHRYLCEFMEMTAAELKGLKTKDMVLAKHAALKHVKAMVDGTGDFPRAKDIMDRDERTGDREEGVADQTVKVTIEYVK